MRLVLKSRSLLQSPERKTGEKLHLLRARLILNELESALYGTGAPQRA